ncbi:MAG: cytochrome c oxidase assembly protein, partial [Gammaproteobacteria bacterium]
MKTVRNTALKLTLLSVVMFGFGYALVPLYDVFCEITGLNGKT